MKGRLFIPAAKLLAVAALLYAVCSGFSAKAAADVFSGGNGSRESPYVITSASGLIAIAENPDAYYILGGDIDLSGYKWAPLCGKSNPFGGVLDGNHFKIKNLSTALNSDCAALFGVVGETGVVENLEVENGQIQTKSGSAAAIAAINYGTIRCCGNSASVSCSASNQALGGIAAVNYGTIQNCFNKGALTARNTVTVGGIAGENAGSVLNCYNIGFVSLTPASGGITGIGGCENCHFLEQGGLAITSGSAARGETVEALKSQATYAGWDFDNVWAIMPGINGGYPYFKTKSGNARLASITLSGGTLSPEFSPDTFDYTANVESGVESVTISATPEDKSAKVSVNGGAGSGTVALSDNENLVNITVTAADGTTAAYTVKIIRKMAPGSKLRGLTLSEGTLSPEFDADILSYTANVDYGVSYIAIFPEADSGASVAVNGQSGAGGVNLKTGENTVTIEVTAPGGEKTTYTLTIVRAEAPSARLSGLSLSEGALSPEFSPDIFYYTASVGYGTDSVDVFAVPESESSTVLVNGKTDFRTSLSAGTNIVFITVSSKDGAVNTYTVKISRASSGNAALRSLGLSSGTLGPAFDPDTLYYAATVPYSVSSVTVTAAPADAGASVAVNGSLSKSDVPLKVGENTVAVTVTSQSGAARTYIITVTRSSQLSARLRSLYLSSGTLSPAFSPYVTNYSARVDYSVSSLVVFPTAADSRSAVYVNGGAAGRPVNLDVGSNTIFVTVSAADGGFEVYTITVTRAYPDKITVPAAGADGSYTADLPGYAAEFGDEGSFTFVLGDVAVKMPVSQIKLAVNAGGAKISKSGLPKQAALGIASDVPEGLIAAGAFSLDLSGGISQLSSEVEVTVSLDDSLKELTKNTVPQVYRYDPDSHAFVKLRSVFDMATSTLKFTTAHFSTFVITVKPENAGLYRYDVFADSFYTVSGEHASFSVRVERQSGSPALYGAELLVATTLSSGLETYSALPLDGDLTRLEITVDRAAVKSSLYLIAGGFDGTGIPASYALVKFVTRR